MLAGWPTGSARGAVPERADDRAAPPRYQRADVPTIRSEVRNILADSRFRARKTLAEWLMETLTRWLRFPQIGKGGWSQIVFWGILVWCVLTLAAILVHWGWVIWTWLGLRGGRARADAAAVAHEDLLERSPDQLRGLMRRLVEQGDFRQAVAVMLVSLLRRLDDLQVVRFHRSKTNGDYVREYPAGTLGRDVFNRLVLAHEKIAYGAAPCRRAEYEQVRQMCDEIQTHAPQRP